MIDEVSAYVERNFHTGDPVFVVGGICKGEEGTIYENMPTSVMVNLTNG